MDQIELFRQIVASCDEALKDVFLRRMEASVRIAQSKFQEGVPVYSANREEQLLSSISMGLSPELQMKARMLWKSLLRMRRNRQYRVFLELDEAEQQKMLQENPAYGNIVCRCEKITEGEILEAIRRPLGATTLDGIKRRTRAGMGRCQAGFCSPRVMEILASELQTDMREITKCGGNSRMMTGCMRGMGDGNI